MDQTPPVWQVWCWAPLSFWSHGLIWRKQKQIAGRNYLYLWYVPKREIERSMKRITLRNQMCVGWSGGPHGWDVSRTEVFILPHLWLAGLSSFTGMEPGAMTVKLWVLTLEAREAPLKWSLDTFWNTVSSFELYLIWSQINHIKGVILLQKGKQEPPRGGGFSPKDK